jgi:hypothetical protein
MAKLPVFLEGYDLFGKLAEWQRRLSGHSCSRTWEIRSLADEGGNVCCRLSWRLTVGTTFLEQYSTHPQEAVYRALSMFDWMESVNHVPMLEEGK